MFRDQSGLIHISDVALSTMSQNFFSKGSDTEKLFSLSVVSLKRSARVRLPSIAVDYAVSNLLFPVLGFFDSSPGVLTGLLMMLWNIL